MSSNLSTIKFTYYYTPMDTINMIILDRVAFDTLAKIIKK